MNAILRLACALCLAALSGVPAAEGAGEQSAPGLAAPASSSLIDPRAFVRVTLPPDGPLELVQLDYGSSRIARGQRGMLMDLNVVLTLRNRSSKAVEGLALALGYGFGRPGAEGLNAVSAIRLEPGEIYALPARMRAEIELPSAATRARPVDLPTSVQVRLDSVLFADGSSYGPDQMRALGTMRINQAESARDRRFFQGLFEAGGVQRLLSVLEKWATEAAGAPPLSGPGTPRLLAREAAERARALAQLTDFRVVRFAGAPLEIVSARARVYERGLVDPALELRNLAGSDIADFQVAWVLRDASGTEFRAATVSGSGRPPLARRFPLSPGESLLWSDPAVLETGPGASGPILSGRVYLRAVQFSSGKIWVPERTMFEAAGLGRLLAGSPEAIRLLRLYRGRGPEALAAELRR